MPTGRYNTGKDDILSEQVADLKRRVADLESGNRIGSTSIDRGTLRVNSGSFQVGDPYQLYFGPVLQGSDVTPGWIFSRADGTIVWTLSGSAADEQFWSFRDNDNNIIVSDDGFSDQGLARPYIPIVFAENSTFAFNVNTTSATFVGLWNARHKKQHPRVRVEALVKCSDGTTGGEIRLFNNTAGVQIGTTVTIGLGAFQIFVLGPAEINPVPTTAGHLVMQEIEVQVRRTAGAGNIGVKIYQAYGEQS